MDTSSTPTSLLPQAPSPLSGGTTYRIPGSGETVVARPANEADIRFVDNWWMIAREPKSSSKTWLWSAIASGVTERYVLEADTKIVAIWTGGDARVCDGRYYVLDYVEVAPGLVGQRLPYAYFVLAVVAARARDLGCEGFVAAALPRSAPFFKNAELSQQAIPGWRPEPGLLPFLATGETFENLWRATYGAEDQESP